MLKKLFRDFWDFFKWTANNTPCVGPMVDLKRIVDDLEMRDRAKKMEMLMLEIKEPAIEIYLNLNKSGVPIVHESRVINVSPAALELARELGVERIFGLRLA
jgi:hypothetical protein